jgi:hypothetical protein
MLSLFAVALSYKKGWQVKRLTCQISIPTLKFVVGKYNTCQTTKSVTNLTIYSDK